METVPAGWGDDAGVTCFLASGLELTGNSAAPVNLPEPPFPRLPTGMGPCWLHEVRVLARRRVSNTGSCSLGSEVVSEKQGRLISVSRRERHCVWEPDFCRQSVRSSPPSPWKLCKLTHPSPRPRTYWLKGPKLPAQWVRPRCCSGTTVSTVSRAFPSSRKDSVCASHPDSPPASPLPGPRSVPSICRVQIFAEVKSCPVWACVSGRSQPASRPQACRGQTSLPFCGHGVSRCIAGAHCVCSRLPVGVGGFPPVCSRE